MHIFEKFLSIDAEDIEFELRGYAAVEWHDFLLNPRRLRGSDFLNAMVARLQALCLPSW